MPLAWLGAFNMTPSRRWLYPVARLIVMSCRSVHEMVWTIVIIAIVGYGMLPGTLAMTLFCIGSAGKLLSEAIESIRKGPVEATRSTGANPIQVFVYAVLPQVRVAGTGIAIYTWDVVFRAATVVGFFGASGMGHFLREESFHFRRTGNSIHGPANGDLALGNPANRCQSLSYSHVILRTGE